MTRIAKFIKTPEFIKRVIAGEVTAYYTRCNFFKRQRRIMNYSMIGQVIDKEGGFCPRVGESVAGFHVDARNHVYARYPTGSFMVGTRPTQRLAFVAEDYINLADYGLPPYILYRFDCCDNFTIRKDGQLQRVKWKTIASPERARYLIKTVGIDIRPVLDVTEEEALAMGFRPTDEPINLSDNLFLRIDEGVTARNSFFIDYYNRAGDDLMSDPYIYYYTIELVRR